MNVFEIIIVVYD